MQSRCTRTIWAIIVGLALIPASAAPSQQQGTPLEPTHGGRTSMPPVLPPTDPQPSNLPRDLVERQVQMANESRQKQLVLDTQKLLALANELNAAVNKSTKETLSLDVIRKADQIEKLAHSVKEKMKAS